MCVYLTHLRDLKTFLSSICLVNAQGINPKDVRGFSGLASHVEKMVQDLPHIENTAVDNDGSIRCWRTPSVRQTRMLSIYTVVSERKMSGLL
jgi:hypothetical protein